MLCVSYVDVAVHTLLIQIKDSRMSIFCFMNMQEAMFYVNYESI